jgi:uncharacterized membrane protein YfcA
VHVSVADWFVIATAVALAATVQGVVGFGGNLLAVPVVALVVPAALPGAMVLPSFPMVATMAVTERAHVDWRGNWFLLLGRLPGTALGVAVVALVSSEVLAVVIGSVVIVAVVVSLAHAELRPRAPAQPPDPAAPARAEPATGGPRHRRPRRCARHRARLTTADRRGRRVRRP